MVSIRKATLLFLLLNSFSPFYKAYGKDYEDIPQISKSDCVDSLIQNIPVSDSLDIYFEKEDIQLKDPIATFIKIGVSGAGKDSLYLRICPYYSKKYQKELNVERIKNIIEEINKYGGDKKIRYIEVCPIKITSRDPNYLGKLDMVTFQFVSFPKK